jgi:hypothetical protein
MLKYFALHHGYVEDQSLACLTLAHREGFNTAEEAMEAWYRFLLVQADERIPRLRRCCGATLELEPDANFCMSCGLNFRQTPAAEDLVLEIWHEIWAGTNDSTGVALWNAMEAEGWSFAWPPEPPIFIFRIERFLNRQGGERDGDIVVPLGETG